MQNLDGHVPNEEGAVALPQLNDAIRVAVCSPQRLLGDALSGYLADKPRLSVVGHTSDLADLVQLCRLRRPDVVLLDANGHVKSDVETLREGFPTVRLVVVYDDESRSTPGAAVEAGVDAVIPYSRGLDAVVAVLGQRTGSSTNGKRSTVGGLTPRDLEIITLMSSGHSVPDMATVLGISPRTVENHKRRIFAKIDGTSQSHVVARAAAMGLVNGDSARPTARAEPDFDHPLLVVLRGDGPLAGNVTTTLLRHGLSFACESRDAPQPPAWARDQRGPLVVTLIDPVPEDWRFAKTLRAPMVAIHQAPLDQATLAADLAQGASSVVVGDKIDSDLVPMLTLVSRGYLAMAATEGRVLLDAAWVRGRGRSSDLPVLTARESDILGCLVQGYTLRHTARELGIAAKTVENTQARLFHKLGARNRAEALAIAHGLGLVPAAV